VGIHKPHITQRQQQRHSHTARTFANDLGHFTAGDDGQHGRQDFIGPIDRVEKRQHDGSDLVQLLRGEPVVPIVRGPFEGAICGVNRVRGHEGMRTDA